MPPSRRQALALAGATLLGGCTGLPRSAVREEMPDPEPFLTEPADWEYPQYDAANTNAPPGYAAPDSLSQKPEVTATFTADQIDHCGGPIVADGIVYLTFTGFERHDPFGRLAALDARTGEKQWQTSVESSWAYTPVVAADTVYWLKGANDVRALSPVDGTSRWKKQQMNHEPPLAAHGLVLTESDNYRKPALEALDPQTGEIYWSRNEGGRSWDIVAADDDSFYARLDAHTDEQSSELHAIDPLTGETQWSTARIAPRSVTVGSQHVYATTGRPDARTVLALDIETQGIAWSETRDMQHDISERGAVNGDRTAAVVADEFVFVHVDWHGAFHDRIEAREKERGKVVWELEGNGDGTVSYAPPIVAGDSLYLLSRRETSGQQATSTLRVLDTTDGTERERIELSAPVYGRPVVADGRLFLTMRTSSGRPDRIRLAAFGES
ncbi:PQQ-binding-like beta-propeller repeat protein [Haloferax sp. S1W]|uniref:outer membrane protein assembly factor BamB family protein n=1 Tax=Haloferax sp. S1W TaxID=3377110 RepID=UPI0037C7FC95